MCQGDIKLQPELQNIASMIIHLTFFIHVKYIKSTFHQWFCPLLLQKGWWVG